MGMCPKSSPELRPKLSQESLAEGNDERALEISRCWNVRRLKPGAVCTVCTIIFQEFCVKTITTWIVPDLVHTRDPKMHTGDSALWGDF